MIFSSISKLDDFAAYPQVIRSALLYLKETDILSLQPGRYDIDGDSVYALVQDIETCQKEERRPEAHREYIDIQYVVRGRERIGFVPLDNTLTPTVSKPENDIYFFADDFDPENFVDMESGDFCIFFPYDVHRPGCISGVQGKVRKVVVKIRYSEIMR